MDHGCIQDERIRHLEQRIDRIEVKYDNLETILKEIKAYQDKLNWKIISLFGTSVITLLALVGNLFLLLIGGRGVG